MRAAAPWHHLCMSRSRLPGKVLFACHLPGHFAYGMKGYVVVVA